MAEIKDENGRKERFFLFYDGESVTGKVFICKLITELRSNVLTARSMSLYIGRLGRLNTMG